MTKTEKMVRRTVIFNETDDRKLKRAAEAVGLDVSSYIRTRMKPIIVEDLRVHVGPVAAGIADEVAG